MAIQVKRSSLLEFTLRDAEGVPISFGDGPLTLECRDIKSGAVRKDIPIKLRDAKSGLVAFQPPMEDGEYEIIVHQEQTNGDVASVHGRVIIK